MQVRYSWDSDLIDDEVLRGSDKGRLRIDGAEGEICTLWWDEAGVEILLNSRFEVKDAGLDDTPHEGWFRAMYTPDDGVSPRYKTMYANVGVYLGRFRNYDLYYDRGRDIVAVVHGHEQSTPIRARVIRDGTITDVLYPTDTVIALAIAYERYQEWEG